MRSEHPEPPSSQPAEVRRRPRPAALATLIVSVLALLGALALEAALPGPKTAPAEAGTLRLAGD